MFGINTFKKLLYINHVESTPIPKAGTEPAKVHHGRIHDVFVPNADARRDALGDELTKLYKRKQSLDLAASEAQASMPKALQHKPNEVRQAKVEQIETELATLKMSRAAKAGIAAAVVSGVVTLAGIALAPFTMGWSLIATIVGALGTVTAGKQAWNKDRERRVKQHELRDMKKGLENYDSLLAKIARVERALKGLDGIGQESPSEVPNSRMAIQSALMKPYNKARHALSGLHRHAQ